MRADRRRFVAGCVVIAAACLVVALLFGGPGSIEQGGPPAKPATPAAVPVDAGVQTPAPAAARVAADPDAWVRFEVVDAATSLPLDGARVAFGGVRRVVELGSLVQLGTTTAGALTVPLARVTSAENDGKVVLTRHGYLPSIVAPPAAAGVRVVAMQQGRMVWVRVVDRSGAAVRGARVAFFAANIDVGLLAEYAGDGPCVAGGGGAWFASVACDADGYASVTLSEQGHAVVASCLGWFQAAVVRVLAVGSERDPSPNPAVTELEDASERSRARDIVMDPVQCAVLAAQPSRILGQSLRAMNGRQWHRVSNILASALAERMEHELSRRFPGDLVIAECIVPASAAVRDAPEVRLSVLVDRVGELDVTARLRPFAEVRLDPLPASAPREPVPLGNLVVDARPGYADDWPSPLYVVREDGTNTPMFSVRHGDSCVVPVGTYRVHELRSPPTGHKDLGTVDVTEGTTCRIEAARFSARWPVVLRVVDAHGASPRFCTLRIRRRDATDVWRMSPSVPSDVPIFLDEGVHEVLASTDGKNWQRTEVSVRPASNRFDVRADW